MKYNGIKLKFIRFLSPQKSNASVDFEDGFNLIQGPSNTGKSFLVSAIDFMLGAGSNLKDIPERVEYDCILLGIKTADGATYTLKRSTDGGSFICYNGLIESPDEAKEVDRLNPRHSDKNEKNISRFLLKILGLDGIKLRTNKQGKTRTLHFRDLSRLAIVPEAEMMKEGSPLEGGQYSDKTVEYALFKLLLTGVDDSAVVPIEIQEKEKSKVSGKIEVMEKLRDDYEAELHEIAKTPNEIDNQLDKIQETIAKQKKAVNIREEQFTEFVKKRKKLWKKYQEMTARSEDIANLLDRFSLLKSHYLSDLERLEAIRESGSIFIYEKKRECPLCGAKPENQPSCPSCEQHVDLVVKAADAEACKIQTLLHELDETVADLNKESLSINKGSRRVHDKYQITQNKIQQTLTPYVTESREAYSELIEKRSEIITAKKLITRIVELKKMIEECEKEKMKREDVEEVSSEIPKVLLNDISLLIASYLKTWNYPDQGNVYFDEKYKVRDFVIAGKPRSSNGKGYRAITHTSFNCSLLDFCRERDLPHPGFVVLDSPLVAYKPPEEGGEPEKDNEAISGSDLKNRFYQSMSNISKSQQVIVIENEAPPSEIINKINFIHFTRNPQKGRYGLLPHVN